MSEGMFALHFVNILMCEGMFLGTYCQHILMCEGMFLWYILATY